MRVSIEWFLLDNFIMNAAALFTASALSGLKPRWPVSFAVCFFGAVYALAAIWLCPVLLRLPFRLLMGGVIALGLNFNGLHGYIRALFCLYICAFLLGGSLFFLSLYGGEKYGMSNGVLLGGISSRLALLLIPLASLTPRFLRRIRGAARLDSMRIPVRLTVLDENLEISALLDTGNLLTEPITGLPVMLVESCPDIVSGYPVSYQGMGEGGEIMCSRAKRAQAYIEGKWRYIDVMVGKAPQKIPHADAILGLIALPPYEINEEGKDGASHNSIF